MARRGINIHMAVRAVEEDYTRVCQALTRSGQDGAPITDYICRILKEKQQKVIQENRKKKRIQSAVNAMDSRE